MLKNWQIASLFRRIAKTGDKGNVKKTKIEEISGFGLAGSVAGFWSPSLILLAVFVKYIYMPKKKKARYC